MENKAEIKFVPIKIFYKKNKKHSRQKADFSLNQ